MRPWLVTIVVVTAVVACGTSEPHTEPHNADADAAPPVLEDGGANPLVDAAADVTPPPADGSSASNGADAGSNGPCGLGTIDIADPNGVIYGTLTLPSAVPRERVRLRIANIYPYPTYAFASAVYGLAGATKDTYTFSLPPPGAAGYYVYADADVDANVALGSNDYSGFYGANGAVPVAPWDAVKITQATATCGLAIKLGTPICHKTWGSPCSTSAECRKTICECNNGSGLSDPYCDLQANQCAHSATLDCTAFCGAGNVKADRQAGCFNQ